MDPNSSKETRHGAAELYFLEPMREAFRLEADVHTHMVRLSGPFEWVNRKMK